MRSEAKRDGITDVLLHLLDHKDWGLGWGGGKRSKQEMSYFCRVQVLYCIYSFPSCFIKGKINSKRIVLLKKKQEASGKTGKLLAHILCTHRAPRARARAFVCVRLFLYTYV